MADQEKEIFLDPNPVLSKPKGQSFRAESKRPPLFLYSLLVPALWFLIGSLLQWLAPTVKLGAIGLALVLYTAVWITCRHFTKKFRRHFQRRERLSLIVLTTTWALLVESLALWAVVEDGAVPGVGDLRTYALLGILAFTLVFDAFMMWAGYTLLAKRIITKMLGTGSAAGA